MSILFISRHPGARQWFVEQGWPVDESLAHLDIGRIRRGDVVIGSLPVHLAAAVCDHGGRYVHLAIDLPAEARGRELSSEEMRRYGARLTEYSVRTVAPPEPTDEPGA